MQYRMLVVLSTMISCFLALPVFSQVREYRLAIDQKEITIEGRHADGMTINGGIPGPTLYFRNGDLARIHLTNRMSVPTSVHWHGLLVPPAMDGVPFVTQKPIAPGTTFTYEFPIRQTGTYWYHSHSGLQEQRGLYGSIVIEDSEVPTDRDHVILLSDWTTESPDAVLRTLKRGSHWYALEKGASQSLLGAARAGRLGDWFMRELQRMPPMDIADVAYDYFLTNGKPEIQLAAGVSERVRLRIINGSATTYFHLNFAGGSMTIISADGQLVEPVAKDTFLIGVAEIYDVLVTMPQEGMFELRATAHDGSGFSSTWLGSGRQHFARDIPPPDLYEPMEHGEMGALFALTPAATMGMSDEMVASGQFDAPGMSHMEHGTAHGGEAKAMGHQHGAHSGHETHTGAERQVEDHGLDMHDMDEIAEMTMDGMADGPSEPSMADDHGSAPAEQEQQMTMDHTPVEVRASEPMADHSPATSQPLGPNHLSKVKPGRMFGTDFGWLAADISSRPRVASEGSEVRPLTPYAELRSRYPTSPPAGAVERVVRLTLDGDMKRYTWFLNDKPLSESDAILIREGEVVRFVMINRTMMHHPMHLHGHFFRVINGQGERSPLKHTVDVAPMSTTVIEFYSDEVGDWFFHCHLLYHMKSGMARLIHYDGFEPDQGVNEVRNLLYNDPVYFYLAASLLTSMSEGEVVLATSRYSGNVSWEVGWEDVEETEWETVLTGSYHRNRFTSFFLGVDVHGEGSSSEETRGVVGLSYLLPFNVESAIWLDSDGGCRVMLEKELEFTPRLGIHGEVEYDSHDEWEGKIELQYLITKELSLLLNYHSEFGAGVGLQFRF